jgi:hypothetical protein
MAQKTGDILAELFGTAILSGIQRGAEERQFQHDREKLAIQRADTLMFEAQKMQLKAQENLEAGVDDTGLTIGDASRAFGIPLPGS